MNGKRKLNPASNSWKTKSCSLFSRKARGRKHVMQGGRLIMLLRFSFFGWGGGEVIIFLFFFLVLKKDKKISVRFLKRTTRNMHGTCMVFQKLVSWKKIWSQRGLLANEAVSRGKGVPKVFAIKRVHSRELPAGDMGGRRSGRWEIARGGWLEVVG